MLLIGLVAALLGGCGSDDEAPSAVKADESETPTTNAPTAKPRSKAPTAARFEGFVTGTDSANPVKADAQKAFVGGEALQFVFRDSERAGTAYQVCHRSSRGRSCRAAKSAGKGEASPFPPLLANTDLLGQHKVVWLVDGQVVARARYSVTPEDDSARADGEPPGGAGNYEGDNANCATLRTSKGLYAVQVQGFTDSQGPACANAEQTVKTYVNQHAPDAASVGEFRCTMATDGDIASGTYGKVTCTTDEPGDLIGVLRGT